jgi:hypothetical protein
MKNFYNSKLELENKVDRVKILKYDIEDLNSKLIKITSTIKENPSTGGNAIQSKIHEYTIQKISKEEELAKLEEDIKYLSSIIKRMEKRVNAMVGIHKEVFELFYTQNIKIKHIALMKNYSPQRIYQVLEEVNKILDINKD